MNLHNFIEHTMLKPEATDAVVRQTVDDANRYRLFGICIAPSWVEFVQSRLSESHPRSPMQIITVVGFPHGNSTIDGKVADAIKAIENGANEIDMVMHIGRFKSGDYKSVVNDINGVVDASKRAGARAVKVILETGFLVPDEIIAACHLAEDGGADFVKTSTGFGPRGASVEDIELMKAAVGGRLGIKASGGIRTREAAMEMIGAGASRIGTSSSVQIIGGPIQHKAAIGY